MPLSNYPVWCLSYLISRYFWKLNFRSCSSLSSIPAFTSTYEDSAIELPQVLNGTYFKQNSSFPPKPTFSPLFLSSSQRWHKLPCLEILESSMTPEFFLSFRAHPTSRSSWHHCCTVYWIHPSFYIWTQTPFLTSPLLTWILALLFWLTVWLSDSTLSVDSDKPGLSFQTQVGLPIPLQNQGKIVQLPLIAPPQPSSGLLHLPWPSLVHLSTVMATSLWTDTNCHTTVLEYLKHPKSRNLLSSVSLELYSKLHPECYFLEEAFSLEASSEWRYQGLSPPHPSLLLEMVHFGYLLKSHIAI